MTAASRQGSTIMRGAVPTQGLIDYHLHLWPHGQPDRQPTVDELASYCQKAAEAGVSEIALTEHLFRFSQAIPICRGFWEEDPDSVLAREMASYWDSHARADLDVYVNAVLEAKAAGLPVVLGLEVDYYPGRMSAVSDLLAGYPFDVLLGSVHWIGAWGFDELGSRKVMAEWSARNVDEVWDAYTRSLEELAATRSCDVMAHPDLVKIAGRYPKVPEEFYDRMAEAARASGMAAEVSSAGWRKPVGEQYPARPLLERFIEHNVPLTTASDAHTLGDVAHRCKELSALISEAGVTELTVYRKRNPEMITLR